MEPSREVFGESTIVDSRSPLFKRNPVYKPFSYPWAYTAWLTQQRLHWLPDEVPMADDIKDWTFNLSDAERNLLTQIFRFFTQMDVEVGSCYLNYYCRIFQPTEIKMMLAAFANIETIHIAAYAHLLDSLGIPEVEYQAFFKYKEMKDKWDYMQQFQDEDNTLRGLTLTLAAYGAFTEGLQLFASFAMLLNFPRFNKMKGMGQVVTWSIRDETLHIHSMLRLFRTIISEHPTLWTQGLQDQIKSIARTMVEHEDAFIVLAFELGGIQGLTPTEMSEYIRFIADRRLEQMNLSPIYGIQKNPLPWMDEMLSTMEHTNFFEGRATEYSKSATQGSWAEVF
jgi:ribonucleoside-diphosphate reductase beta chain